MISKEGKGKIKKIVAAAVSLTLAGTIGTFILKRDNPNIKDNQYGYQNVNLTNIINMEPENFVVLNVGDHNSIRLLFQDKRMEFCNKNDIALGVMISSNAETENEIYDDVEYTKSLIEQYDIKFPVYLNIDDIITNNDLNNEMKKEIIKSYLEKLSANHVYVGIAGTDTNLCRVRKYCDIKDYDAYLIMDSDEIKYEGTYNLVQKQDGTLESYANLEQVITNKDLNNAKNFINDGKYIVSEGEEIIDIALKYGMSVNELLHFNGIKLGDIEAGTILRIPSILGTEVTKEEKTGKYKQLEEPIRGCDISYAQSDNCDWDKLQENFEFIILRSNQGLTEDSYFEQNAKNCNLYGIPIGVYCFNNFDNTNCETLEEFNRKQQEQANFTLKTLENKNIEYPVYLDIEGNVPSRLSPTYINEMLKNWCKTMTEAGYVPGIYCNQSNFKYIQECTDYNLADKMSVWIAGGEQYGLETNPEDNITLNDVKPSYSILNDETFDAEVVQSTNVATNAGAHDGRGHLDINYSTVDYSEPIIKELENIQFDTKEFPFRNVISTAADTGVIVIPGLGIAVMLGALAKRKRKVK